MKVKPFVAATLISGLGLVGSAAIAATNQSKGPAYDAPAYDYSAIVRGNSVMPNNGLVNVGRTAPCQPAPVSTVKGPAYDLPAKAGIPLSIGMIANVDAYAAKSQYEAGAPFESNYGSNFYDVYVRNVNLFLSSSMGIAHGTVNFGANNHHVDTTLNGGSKVSTNGNVGLGLDEAYVSLYQDSFAFPVYMTVGRKYINFGNYDVYSTLPSLTQYMSEVNGAGAEVGFVAPSGGNAFYGSVTGFGGPQTSPVATSPEGSDTKAKRYPVNFSARLGMQGSFHMGQDVAYTAEVGYLHNVADLSYYNLTSVPGFIGPFNGGTAGGIATASIYAKPDSDLANKALGAVSAHLGFKMDSGCDKMATALNVDFVTFLGKAYGSDITKAGKVVSKGANASSEGSPWAVSLAASYAVHFIPMMEDAAVLVGGGYSKNAGFNADGTDGTVGLGLPEWQAHVGLGVGITRNLDATLLYQYNALPKSTATNSGTVLDLSGVGSGAKASNMVMLQFGLDV